LDGLLMAVVEEQCQLELNPAVPAVSWLLCAHVVNDHLKLAIDSCLAQTISNFELLIVANGPKAAEVDEAVRAWHGADNRVRVFITPIRQLSFSLSLGLHYARAALIARMDSDDLSSPDRLERQVAFMTEHVEVAVLGTSYQIIDSDGHMLQTIAMPSTDRLIRRGLLRGNPLCHPTVMFRRQVVLDAGGYLGGLHAEDYDLWSRLALNPTLHFANLPHVCLGYRVIGVGTARRSRWAYASMAASQTRNFLVGAGLRWGAAVVLSVLKLLLRSSSIRDES
jgi:glycosyltransferase involved in cell wall biosynthesis